MDSYKKVKKMIEQQLQIPHLQRAKQLIDKNKSRLENDIEFIGLTSVYYYLEGNKERAKAWLKKGLEVIPYDFELLYNYWRICEEEEAYIEGLPYFLKAYYLYVQLTEEETFGVRISLQEEKSKIYKFIRMIEDNEIRVQAMKEVDKQFEKYENTLAAEHYKIFPIKSDETLFFGDWLHVKDAMYFVGKYKQKISHASINTIRYFTKAEIIPAVKEVQYIFGEENKKYILPLAWTEEHTQITLIEDQREYIITEGTTGQFVYYPTKGICKVTSDKPIAIGKPILLGIDKTKPRLVVTLFVDGLSYACLEEQGIKKLMPNTYRYFKKGVCCTNVYTTGEWTLPSVAAICTGQDTVTHKLYHPDRNDVLPEDIETLFEMYQREGYVTAKIDGNWRNTPRYGYARGIDRAVYEAAIYEMDARDVIGEALLQMETFKETNQYLWLGFMDLHGVGDDFKAGLYQESHLQLDKRIKESNIQIKSVRQSYDARKEAVYHQAIRQLDMELESLYHYINDQYAENEVVISLISDHGQAYIIPNEEPFFTKKRSHVPLMIKGYKEGECKEKIQLTDYIAIMAQSTGVELKDKEKRQAYLPVFFGGTEERAYVYTESIYPGSPYKACIRTDKVSIHFETKDRVLYNGRVRMNDYILEVIYEQKDAQPLTLKERDKFVAIIQDHMKKNNIYE